MDFYLNYFVISAASERLHYMESHICKAYHTEITPHVLQLQ